MRLSSFFSLLIIATATTSTALVACSSPTPTEAPAAQAGTTNKGDAGANGVGGGGNGANNNNNKKDAGAGSPNTTNTANGSGSVSGKPDGKEIAVKSASAEIFATPGTEGPIHEIVIGVSDSAVTACGGAITGDVRGVDLSLTFSHDAKFPDAKTYSFTGQNKDNIGPATITFYSTAGEGAGSFATDGSITITEVDATHVKGKFTATFDGNKVEGAFDAPMCPESSGGDKGNEGDENEGN